MYNYTVMENKPIKDIDSENYGLDNYVPVAYCTSVKSAMKYLVDREVLATEFKDFETVMNAIESLKEDIEKLNI